jgi:hypothetical protein
MCVRKGTQNCSSVSNELHFRPSTKFYYCYWIIILLHNKKAKQSRNRPDVIQRVPGGLGSQIFMTFGTWRWWGCQPHAPSAFTSRKCSWYSFSLGYESTPEPWNGRKDYVTEKSCDTTGINPGTVRPVAQRLNHYVTHAPVLHNNIN